MEVISIQDFMRRESRGQNVVQSHILTMQKEIPLDEAYDSLMVILINFYLMYDY
jgi:hypothetical protein